ncbi:ADP-ribosylation factor 6-like protein [Anaeromyces robustus]|uniref:ADP-ribosylation factor 6-like protein n=1 Tax=Anaeromyces robustus TaxID=1754192 RepID=A0A1Y1WVJ3_9FUNG|nr:ADP-ribosylation factor 6-like protein [Anaeromyces robustus]|eukprot:ORX77533.1 ADP-ribosylation factor 6-like protein [Anaeromyces robustus]
MGKVLSKFGKNKEMRLLMLGLDCSGKTTILYKLKGSKSEEKPPSTVPTVGFNVEEVTFRKVKFSVWDVGGQDKIRPLWRHYYAGTQGLIFIVDSSDRNRIEEAGQELFKIIQDQEMSKVNVLVLANKQDIEGALSAEEIKTKMKLENIKDRQWCIFPCCAVTGEGLEEGLNWLDLHCTSEKKSKKRRESKE